MAITATLAGVERLISGLPGEKGANLIEEEWLSLTLPREPAILETISVLRAKSLVARSIETVRSDRALGGADCLGKGSV